MLVATVVFSLAAVFPMVEVSHSEPIHIQDEPLKLTTSPGSHRTPRIGSNGKIVYVSTDRNVVSLMTMNGDGTDKRLVTNTQSGTYEYPSWGPNGEILFTFFKGGNGNLFIIGTEGTGLRQLTNYQFSGDVKGVWGRDGTIVYCVDFMFESAINQGGYFTISPDGSGRKKLRRTRLGKVHDWPSGGPIYFSERESGRLFEGTYRDNNGQDPKGYSTPRPGISQIFAMEEDGTAGRRLTTDNRESSHPAVCPDGRIVFVQTVKKRGTALSSLKKIMIMDPDGTNITPLTKKDGVEAWPSVSDSGIVVFQASYGGNFDIYSTKLPER